MENKDEAFILENIKLLYWLTHRYSAALDPVDREFFDGIALIKYLQACKKYDKTVGSFSTYLAKIIKNELMRFEKKSNKSQHYNKYYVDLNGTIPNSSMTYQEIIEDKNSNLQTEQLIHEAYEYTNKNLSKRDSKIFNYYLLGYKQREISNNVGVSQAEVSRTISKVQKELKEALL